MNPDWLIQCIKIRGEDGNTISFAESYHRRSLIVSIENDNCTARVVLNEDHIREIEKIRDRLELREPLYPEE